MGSTCTAKLDQHLHRADDRLGQLVMPFQGSLLPARSCYCDANLHEIAKLTSTGHSARHEAFLNYHRGNSWSRVREPLWVNHAAWVMANMHISVHLAEAVASPASCISQILHYDCANHKVHGTLVATKVTLTTYTAATWLSTQSPSRGPSW